MDHRRPVRPPPAARRALFHATASRRHPNPLHAQNPLHPSNPASSNPNARPAMPIATEEPDPANDLVERDSAGNYKISAPITAMKMGVGGARTEADEELEQENQMIALYGKESQHWDQAAVLEEIQVALQSSCERKVQSLEQDRWMFEGEGKGKG
ncbi:hypothetical protein K458DRAFT_312282 [Lentithecium fluviatile CBS 122367]|uniref:Uncharacterized protein n=1 Tax=Lentithecium fluviatile CBS 122367 TaxID=1168545 RepID=A0A6G1IQ19_9PLEO|nr:hypothetical protein K458DRAFT_312282 [Lentithecium fluviatile CBS 122367]